MIALLSSALHGTTFSRYCTAPLYRHVVRYVQIDRTVRAHRNFLKEIQSCQHNWKNAKSLLSIMNQTVPKGASKKAHIAVVRSLLMARDYQALLSFMNNGMYLEGVCLETYRTAIVGCCKNHNPEAALTLLALMKEKSISPDIICLNSVISSCAKLNKYSVAFKLFNAVETEYDLSPDSYSYVAILTACELSSRYETAKQVFTSIKQTTDATEHVYLVMFRILGKFGSAQEVFELYEQSKQREPLVLNSNIHSAAITALVKAKDEKLALKIFDEFINKNCVGPNQHVFTSAISACSSLGEVEKAESLFKLMQSKFGIKPELVVCSALISAYQKRGEARKALAMLEFLDQNNISPDVVCLSAVVSACANGHQTEQAIKVFESFKRRGVKPNAHTISSMINVYSRAGKWQEAIDIYESYYGQHQLLPMNTHVCSVVISACHNGGQWQKALDIYESMRSRGMELNAHMISAAIAACDKGNQWQKALDLFDSIKNEGFELDGPCYHAILKACEKKGDWHRALDLFEQMQQASHNDSCLVDSDTFGIMIQLLEEAGQLKRALAIFMLAQEKYGLYTNLWNRRETKIDLHLLQASVARIAMTKFLCEVRGLPISDVDSNQGNHQVCNQISELQESRAYFEKRTVAALKALLRARNLPLNGKKADLVDRLVSEPVIENEPVETAEAEVMGNLETSQVKEGEPSYRDVLIITGRGLHSKNASVLPSAMRNFFKTSEYAQGVQVTEVGNPGAFAVKIPCY